MNSAVYHGVVSHARQGSVAHAFSYDVFMMYLDLSELAGVFEGRWFWSAQRPAVAWFRRADYLGDPAIPLDEAVRSLVATRTGTRPTGPIRLLTNLRYFGVMMNPVSFYYCYDAGDTKVEAIVAEVTNTPWGERHAYVLPASAGDASRTMHRFELEKAMHVSPFLDMEQRYDWRFSAPGRRLIVHMKNMTRRGKVFDATLSLRREELNAASLANALTRHPFMTAKVGAGIYWQALRLWLKGAPFHSHPAPVRSNVAYDVLR